MEKGAFYPVPSRASDTASARSLSNSKTGADFLLFRILPFESDPNPLIFQRIWTWKITKETPTRLLSHIGIQNLPQNQNEKTVVPFGSGCSFWETS